MQTRHKEEIAHARKQFADDMARKESEMAKLHAVGLAAKAGELEAAAEELRLVMSGALEGEPIEKKNKRKVENKRVGEEEDGEDGKKREVEKAQLEEADSPVFGRGRRETSGSCQVSGSK